MEPLQNPDIQTKPASERMSAELLERHLNAFRNNDLEGVLSDFTDESVLIAQDAIYQGHEQIKNFFAGLIPFFPTYGSSIEVDQTVIKENLVYIIWHARTPVLDLPFATDTIIVQNGKIRLQTFAGQLNFI